MKQENEKPTGLPENAFRPLKPGECLRAWKSPATEKQGPGLPHAIRGEERGQRERMNTRRGFQTPPPPA